MLILEQILEPLQKLFAAIINLVLAAALAVGSASQEPAAEVRESPSPTVRPTSKPKAPVPVATSKWKYDPEVSWYGPGFYCIHPTKKGCVRDGTKIWLNGTACGQLYTKTIMGVAHRTLPCGTLVEFQWRGRTARVPVIDRGPFVRGRTWDLSGALCVYLKHCFTGPIRWRVIGGG